MADRDCRCGIAALRCGMPAVVDIAAGLSAQERVALFCVATGIEHPAVGMVAMMRAMRNRGLIVREGAPNRYALTEVGRDVFKLILEQSGFGATERVDLDPQQFGES